MDELVIAVKPEDAGLLVHVITWTLIIVGTSMLGLAEIFLAKPIDRFTAVTAMGVWVMFVIMPWLLNPFPSMIIPVVIATIAFFFLYLNTVADDDHPGLGPRGP